MNVLEAEVAYSPADYARAFEFMSRRLLRSLNVMMVLGAVVFALVLYRKSPASFDWWVVPAIAGLVVLFLGLIKLTRRWNIGRQVKSVPTSQGPHLWTISEEGIAFAGPLSSGSLTWGAILRVRESEDDFYFYTGKRLAHFLPKRVFMNQQEISDLRGLIIDKLGKKAELI